ncbi:hypothetical protein FRB99_007896 [Tulasnella sp. 403]|nr:hypothetical protein FRB99_007896 [Tulasnella sp. 403]
MFSLLLELFPIPQHAADSAALQLQRRSFDANQALERQRQLEVENARLTRELDSLSRHPDKSPHPATLSVSELTLAHRRLSERLSDTESILLERTTDLQNAVRKASSLTFAVEQSQQAIERARRGEESAKGHARSLETILRVAMEEKAMAERTIEDYAALVRRMQRRTSQSTTSLDGTSVVNLSSESPTQRSSLSSDPSAQLEASRTGLQRLLHDFNTTSETLQQEISRLHTEIEDLKHQLDVERRGSEEDRTKLALAKVELDQYMADDRAAAKLVSRYMKFSQTSIDLLQSALDTQRARLNARITTLEGQNEALAKSLEASHGQTARLRDALDELTEDISRESHGRRREVALRLKMVSREEQTVSAMRQLLRRVEEGLGRLDSNSNDRPDLLARVQVEMKSLLDGLDGSEESLSGFLLEAASSSDWSQGSVARVVSCQETVTSLVAELQMETEKRLALEKRVSDLQLQDAGLIAKDTPNGLATPSDLGLGESRETLVENSIAVQPLSSSNPVSMTNSPAPPPNETSITSTTLEPRSPSPPVVRAHTPEPEPEPEIDIQPPLPVPQPLETIPKLAVQPTSPEPVTPKISTYVVPQSEVSPVLEVDVIPEEPPVVQINGAISLLDIRPEPSPLIIPAPITSEPSPSPVALNSSIEPPAEPSESELLLQELLSTSGRYNSISSSLKNCHTSLSRLKLDFDSVQPTPAVSFRDVALIKGYLDRLNDYIEDGRVELEIRIADEARLAKGYETVLGVPGALPEDGLASELGTQIVHFARGTDPSIVKATENFQRKVADLEHDIALLKRVIHERGLITSPSNDLALPSATSAPPWSWTGLLASPTRPRPSSPAPTFGAVMTQRSPTSSPSLPDVRTLHTTSPAPLPDDLANLAFRIPMPRATPVLLPPKPTGYNLSPSPFGPLSTRSKPSGAGLGNSLIAGRRFSGGVGIGSPLSSMMRSASTGIFPSPRILTPEPTAGGGLSLGDPFVSDTLRSGPGTVQRSTTKAGGNRSETADPETTGDETEAETGGRNSDVE